MRFSSILFALVIAGSATEATEARADGVDLVPKIGFRVGWGAIPIDVHEGRTSSLGLNVEHPVFGKTRVFAEWEWLWINQWNEPAAMEKGETFLHGSGQRAEIGLRRALAVKSFGSELRMFIDGELGGGAMLSTDDHMGTGAVPVGLAGVRLGYDFRNGNSPSRVLEAELIVRTFIVPTGYGTMFGVGFQWGD